MSDNHADPSVGGVLIALTLLACALGTAVSTCTVATIKAMDAYDARKARKLRERRAEYDRNRRKS